MFSRSPWPGQPGPGRSQIVAGGVAEVKRLGVVGVSDRLSNLGALEVENAWSVALDFRNGFDPVELVAELLRVISETP